MNVGIIGLGKMGFGMAQRLLKKNILLIAYDLQKTPVEKIKKEGAIGADSLLEFANLLKLSGSKISNISKKNSKTILLSVPAGEIIDKIISEIKDHLEPGDIIIDTSNSFFIDSQIRASNLLKDNIHFIDAGLSGGILGARDGACVMVGGEKEIFTKIEFIFKALSKNNSYQYMGKTGAGHLVKGYHNFVEYGYMQSLAEGVVAIEKISSNESLSIDINDVLNIWNKGSIIESRLVNWTRDAFVKFNDFEKISGIVSGQTQLEMERLMQIAEKMNIDVPACKAAIEFRANSVKKPSRIGKILNGMRHIFGGHEEWKND